MPEAVRAVAQTMLVRARRALGLRTDAQPDRMDDDDHNNDDAEEEDGVLLALPTECTERIFSYLTAFELTVAAQVRGRVGPSPSPRRRR